MPLIIINSIIYLMQIVLDSTGIKFTDSFMLVSHDVFTRPWILLTAIFLHGSPSHLLFNMYSLFMFGNLIEQRIGPKKFIFIYLLSGIFASFVSCFFYDAALGASGAIMAIIGMVIILLPELQILLFFAIPMSMRTAGIIFILMDTFGVFYPNGTANIAHLAGVTCGLLYALYLKDKNKKFHKRIKSKNHLDSEDIKEYFRSGRI
jgi:uncharacterized protein